MSRKVADTMEVGGSGLRDWRSSYLVLGRLLPSGPFDDRLEPSRVVDHPDHESGTSGSSAVSESPSEGSSSASWALAKHGHFDPL